MARRIAPPLVDHTHLVQPERAAEAILVGSPAWYDWLAGATSFAFVGEYGNFTAHKERRGLHASIGKPIVIAADCIGHTLANRPSSRLTGSTPLRLSSPAIWSALCSCPTRYRWTERRARPKRARISSRALCSSIQYTAASTHRMIARPCIYSLPNSRS